MRKPKYRCKRCRSEFYSMEDALHHSCFENDLEKLSMAMENHCSKHKHSYARFCWFCFCNWLHKPVDFAYHSGYDSELLDQFLKAYPNGRI